MSALNEKKTKKITMPDLNKLQPADMGLLKVGNCIASLDSEQYKKAKDKAYQRIITEIASQIFNGQQAKEKNVIKIKANEFLTDIKTGMSDQDLMDKHRLNERQLQSAFRKMIKAGKLSAMEIAKRLYITESQTFTALFEADQLNWKKQTKKK